MRRLLARIPTVAYLCAAAALLNLVAWSFLVPPFQAPDEAAHFAYVQELAVDGTAPAPEPGRSAASTEVIRATALLGTGVVIGNPHVTGPRTAEQDRAVDEALHAPLASDDGGGASTASPQPPLYYALGTAGYWAAEAVGGTVLDDLAFVRLVSCLISMFTVLFVVLFVRELLPGTPLAWAAAGVAVAFQPMFAFIGSSTNPDALLFAASAALFFALARSFRLGLTRRRGVLIAAVLAAGLLTKLTFVGLVPGALLAIAVLVMRAPRGSRGPIVAASAATAVLPLAAYLALTEIVWGRPVFSAGTSPTPASGPVGVASRRGFLSYLWQYYLPRAPFLQRQFIGYFPLWDVWFKGLVGRFGWLDYGFPAWVYEAALACWAVLLAFIARALILARAAVRRRRVELAAYALMMFGLLLLIAKAGYGYRAGSGENFEQARYLLPLVALYGGLIGLAIRGAGPRLAPYLAVLIASAAIVHNVFAQILTVGRYYA